jgi:RNA polymerase sigma-70 factor (ECF subfamily)
VDHQEAFIRIIKENEGIIFKISTVYTNNEDDQKDLYQEIVLQLWKAFSQFRKDAKISTWLYRVALNTAITQFRKAKKNSNQISIDKIVLNYTENANTVFEERLKTLYYHIATLNDLEKGIILLYLEDKNYEEIAAITGLSVTNVGTRLSRIKQKIKSQISAKKD